MNRLRAIHARQKPGHSACAGALHADFVIEFRIAVLAVHIREAVLATAHRSAPDLDRRVFLASGTRPTHRQGLSGALNGMPEPRMNGKLRHCLC
jgi:hypothetical protein